MLFKCLFITRNPSIRRAIPPEKICSRIKVVRKKVCRIFHNAERIVVGIKHNDFQTITPKTNLSCHPLAFHYDGKAETVFFDDVFGQYLYLMAGNWDFGFSDYDAAVCYGIVYRVHSFLYLVPIFPAVSVFL